MHVLIVEDDQPFRETVRDVVQRLPQIERVSEAGTLEEAYGVSTTAVDVIVLDLGLPDSHGLQTVQRIVSAFPQSSILVLTGTYVDQALGEQLTRLGVLGYWSKLMLRRVDLGTWILTAAACYQRCKTLLEPLDG